MLLVCDAVWNKSESAMSCALFLGVVLLLFRPINVKALIGLYTLRHLLCASCSTSSYI